jgi:hypothetical protein
MSDRAIHGDCLQVLRELPNDSVGPAPLHLLLAAIASARWCRGHDTIISRLTRWQMSG